MHYPGTQNKCDVWVSRDSFIKRVKREDEQLVELGADYPGWDQTWAHSFLAKPLHLDCIKTQF